MSTLVLFFLQIIFSVSCIVFLSFLFFSFLYSLLFSRGKPFPISGLCTTHQSDFKACSWFLWLNMVISIRHESLYIAILIMFQEIDVFFFFLMFYNFFNAPLVFLPAHVLICSYFGTGKKSLHFTSRCM